MDLESTRPGRRDFLLTAGLTVGAGLIAAPGLAQARPTDGDVGILNGALALEHEGIAAYRLAGASGLLSAGTLQVATVFMGHHEQHRDALVRLIRDAGGAPAEPRSDADYVQALSLETLKSEGDVVALATRLEQGATNAYAGQVAALSDKSLIHLFGQLSADEAVHWATLNNAAGTAIPAQAFLFG